MDTLYHYTNLAGFDGIFSSGKIWLNNSLISNDFKEILWVVEVIRKHLPDQQEKVQLLEDLYKSWVASFYRPHICCFSKNGDQLSQWRGYADDGKGIAIGFNREYFTKTQNLDDDRDFLIEEVIYDLDTQFEMVSRFLAGLKMSGGLGQTTSSHTGGMQIVGRMLQMGVCFKNPSFVEEQEIRLVHGNGRTAAEPDMFEYRFTDDSMLTYIEIMLTHENTDVLPVRELIIGPKCKITIPELKDYLMTRKINPLEIEIRHSQCTYR